MPCSWEGNRRSGVALAMYYHLAHGLRKGDEHPRLYPVGVRHNLPYSSYAMVYAVNCLFFRSLADDQPNIVLRHTVAYVAVYFFQTTGYIIYTTPSDV